MISDEMKHTEHYRMYAEVFGIDVPLTQSQPTESTQGTHRTPSAPRSPNPKVNTGESSAPKWLTVIHFRIPQRRFTRLTPPALVPTIAKADEMILQDTLQVSLAEHKIREEQEARENVELMNKHLASEEIEKMVDKLENVINDSPIPRNDDQNIPGTRLEPRSDTESPEVEITNVVIPVNVNEEEEEITDEVYELKRREKGKIVEESRSTPSPKSIRSPRIHIDLVSSDIEKLQELTKTNTTPTPSSSSLNTKLSTTNRLLSLFKAKPARFKLMVGSLPTMVDKHIKEQVEKQVPEQFKERGRLQAKISSQIQQEIDNHIPSLVDASIKFETLQVPQTTCRTSAVRPRDQDDPHDDAPPKGENSNQEQVDDYDFWTESYASDDDEIPMKQVSQDIMEEVSLTINEAELKKIADEMLRQRCNSGDEHQYHVDQMNNFLKSDIV
ncbi:hypothetical protein Tco_0296395 [Tanacetum coccineum]